VSVHDEKLCPLEVGMGFLPLVAAERITQKKTLRWIVVVNWFHARSISKAAVTEGWSVTPCLES
jgi:hypothetical protein